MSSLLNKLDHAVEQLDQVSSIAKARHQFHVIDICGRVLAQDDGINQLYSRIVTLTEAGLFEGTDWGQPEYLVPNLVPDTLAHADKATVVLDCLSQLRMLAIVEGKLSSPPFSQQEAHQFLARVLSLNLSLVMGLTDESNRIRLGATAPAISTLYRFILSHLGYETILSELVDEVWRVLAQRPIQVNPIKAMINQISILVSQEQINLGEAKLGIDRLVSALYGPTQGCYDDPGLDAYCERLNAMDGNALQQEALGFARAMHDVGLASDYHAIFLRWLLDNEGSDTLPTALGLSNTGLDCLVTYRQLVHTLIQEAIYPQTAQAVYGLAMMLERGVLFDAPVAPSLWRQIHLNLHPDVAHTLTLAFGEQLPARVHLLAGVMSVLGQPLGVAQGNNPTCQSARAISMWAYNDPDYLLNCIVQVACNQSLRMHFEGQSLDSHTLLQGLSTALPFDTDPVSVVLVPHLDKLYIEMGRLCVNREQDPHKWINPEFHGWYVGREFMIAVDVKTGQLKEFDSFIERFYRSYHPLYNGNIPVIHPQPVGIAVTSSQGRFVGWHAITLIRIALDQDSVMRVYFYNPNNDSGQDWGHDVVVSTQGKGEQYGEASLPFEQFLSRLYLYHDDTIQVGIKSPLPSEALNEIKRMAFESWAQERIENSTDAVVNG
ncbi:MULTISPECIES: hypothetical protein [unclassified Salinivibrio]|uniref:hypothetical protein n=1 Tax=unclassified Salinivibrio TaxID=2636825 RepID=UPI00128DD499|nr:MULTISPECIES: hypothetical protein [unclassified Salinivibrio]MPS31730.1 hypothetical protein [Salinivibrio sp. VYel7]MPX90300.1 hypothetical protein [Salinivibrio sp. VYel1]MPX93124.1 hypothetical protein [Salinivibrio sp. VYel9]MPX95192.1 hypothetical protein [Salinivibrio sp. VYel6]MPX99342.1 hypothetical protein [Salinivibrio sp. VYel4]